MRTVGRWFVGFLGLLWNIFVVFPFMYVPILIVGCVLWVVYTLGFAFGLAVLAGWGTYQVYPVWWVGGIVGLLVAMIYWWTIWFIYNETDGWPYQPGQALFYKIVLALPQYDFD